MQIIWQQLAPAQHYCAVRALGITEVILRRASPAGLMQNRRASLGRRTTATR